MTRHVQAIALHADDDVAVAIADLRPGVALVRRGAELFEARVTAPIAFGHKFALRAIAAGATIRKYGETIGEASADIAIGAHVHVHNLRSRRARADAGR